MTMIASPHAVAPETRTPCDACGQVHARCVYHRKKRGANGELIPCGQRPIRGQLNCRMHWNTKAARAAGGRRLALGEAMAELDRLGRPIPVDPSEAMLAMVHEAAGNVAVYRFLVQSLDSTVDQEPGGFKDDREEPVDPKWRDELGKGLAGRTDPANWRAAPHVWVAMYDEERERLVKWAKMCRDAGVDERRVELAEQEADLLSDSLRVLAESLLTAFAVLAPAAAAAVRGQLDTHYARAIDVIAPDGGER